MECCDEKFTHFVNLLKNKEILTILWVKMYSDKNFIAFFQEDANKKFPDHLHFHCK